MTVVASESPPFTPLAESLARLENAVSPLTGIVTRVVRSTHMPDETSLPSLACQLASARRTLGTETVEYGSGASTDHERARAAAIGEALERYSGSLLPYERLQRCTARSLGPRAIPPEHLSLFHPLQVAHPSFPFGAFTEDTETVFAEGVSLADGGPAYAPAELVYLRPPPLPTRPIGYSTSSGLACGPTWCEATLAALLELIERDAVMLAWNCRLSLPCLDWSCDARARALDDRFFRPTGLRYAVVDGSAFMGVPVAISVLHGHPGSRTALAVGAACAAFPSDAWSKALSECFGVYRWLGRAVADRDTSRPESPEDVQTFDDHMLYYASEETAERAAFLDAAPERRRLTDVPPLPGATPQQQLDALLDGLTRRGIAVSTFDVTSPDVRSLGLRVVRVLAPGLCPLDVSHTARFLGGSRLYTAAADAGLLDRRLTLMDINPDPHPFP
jgi:ribosomal protein S12 methylthiotransferase accessory factor